MKSQIFTTLIGGKAGEGVKKAAQVIASISSEYGQYTFQTDDYQSLIKGGHNFSVVSISSDKLYNSYKKADLVISFDARSRDRHIEDMGESALHYCDESDANQTGFCALPLKAMVKKHYAKDGNLAVSAIAIFCAQTGISEEEMIFGIKSGFQRNLEANIAFARELYRYVMQHYPAPLYNIDKQICTKAKSYTGNQLIALGAWVGGLDLYFSYPMTPASSILSYLAKIRDSHGVQAIHAESELAAINMAIGAAFAGRRSAIGSSGGGFALMQEGLSLAGMVEAPLLCILSSRPGPATGVSTYTAQEDLYFALNQGHGEFPKIVASPDSFERAFSLAAELMDLAWETQSPAILLTEKHLSESMSNVSLNLADLSFSEIDFPRADADYQRYHITDSGISPLAFPGVKSSTDEAVIKWNSNEHLESGVRTDVASDIVKMKDKRNRKQAAIEQASRRYQRAAVYGSGGPIVFAYGSTALELREAQKYLKFELVVPIFLEPFPHNELSVYQDKEVIVVEHASRAHFSRLLVEKLNIKVRKDILRYDGRHFSAEELVSMIKEASDA